ncbi:MAG: GIY-YIG nuclease family protein [Promethearchaeota archaeon]|jgi:Uri superfamily endonuclease
MKGSYILVIRIPEKTEIYVGILGKVQFNKGYYLYIGSGMGNFGSSTLINRVKRHLRPSNQKKVHWHIDYLLNERNSYITQIYLIPSLERLECIITKELVKNTESYVRNFGSSDCDCQSHLLYSKEFKGLDVSEISI